MLVAILGVAAGSAHATGQYIYDDLGRLVQVTLPNGATIHYQYDANGNVLSINRVNSSAVVISTFAPASGAAGSTVTISGSGFNSTASQNTVRFNGANATIVSASSTQLRVLVPSGATTGPIVVTTPAGSAASHQSFVVTSMAVTSISPAIGLPGTAVSISGSGFSPSLAANQIDFENARASTTSASTTVLRTAVPNAARSGPIRITTPYGSVTSPMDFVIPPAGYQPHDVAVAARVPVNGNPQSYTFGVANKIGVLLFTGTQGQRISVVQTGVTLASGAFNIYTPSGTVFYTGTIRNDWVVDLNALPESGAAAVNVVVASTPQAALRNS